MRFRDTLTGSMLTTLEWLAKHEKCLAEDEHHQVSAYSGDWFLLICGCTSRHLCHDDERAALVTHRGIPPGLAPRLT
jgi:hypothetical protein